MTVLSLATDERRDLLEFLRTLTLDEWAAPSLCSEWRVRDVVSHIVSYGGLGPADLGRRFIAGRMTLAGANRAGVEDLRRSPAELLTRLEQTLRPSGVTVGFGGRIALTDSLIHHQDIRRPLCKALRSRVSGSVRRLHSGCGRRRSEVPGRHSRGGAHDHGGAPRHRA